MTFAASLSLDETEARAVADRLGDEPRFDELPVDVAERSDGRWEVVVYFGKRPDRSTRARLIALAAETLRRRLPPFTVRELPAADWVAMSLRRLAPVRAGRFLVHGRHDRAQRRPNDLAIEIEAAQAFGTGHHGSTVGCLLAIDRIATSRPILNALDLGTGSGVLAIAIAKAGKARVLASDIDPVAVRIAGENARLNGVASRIRTVVAAGLAGRAFRERAPFDLIVANILAGPLATLAPALRRHVAPGGTVILSGLLVTQRRWIVAAYRGQGLRCVRDFPQGEWLTIVFERPT